MEDRKNILKGVTIFISMDLVQYDRLKDMAIDMGATVERTLIYRTKESSTDTRKVVDYIISNTRNNYRCVPSSWLINCYEQGRHLPRSNFPVDLHKSSPPKPLLSGNSQSYRDNQVGNQTKRENSKARDDDNEDIKKELEELKKLIIDSYIKLIEIKAKLDKA